MHRPSLGAEISRRTPLRVRTRRTETSANSLASSMAFRSPPAPFALDEDGKVLRPQDGLVDDDLAAGEPQPAGLVAQGVRALGRDEARIADVEAAAEQQHVGPERELALDGAEPRARVGHEVARARRRVLGERVLGLEALDALLERVAVLVEVVHVVERACVEAVSRRDAHGHPVDDVVGEQREPVAVAAFVEQLGLAHGELVRLQVARVGERQHLGGVGSDAHRQPSASAVAERRGAPFAPGPSPSPSSMRSPQRFRMPRWLCSPKPTYARPGPGHRSTGVLRTSPSRSSPMRLLSFSRRARLPVAIEVIDVQFSTSSCSNIPDEPKHIRYALYESALKRSGASRSTANHERTSVRVALSGCHSRIEMNGATVPSRFTCGQLWTKLRFGMTVAAETMKRASCTVARCSGDHVSRMRAAISAG